MRINTEQFPLVWISSEPSDNWEDELNQLLQQDQRFVLLTREIPTQESGDENSNKSRLSDWLKKNKEAMQQVCAGSVIIVNNQLIAMAIGFALAPLSKTFGYPMLAITEDNLDATIETLLNS